MSEPTLTEAEIQQINVEARAYAETLVDAEDVDGTPQYICYIKGATTYALRAKEREQFVEQAKALCLKASSKVNELEALLKSKDDRWEEVKKKTYDRILSIRNVDPHTEGAKQFKEGVLDALESSLQLMKDKIDSQPKDQQL